MSWTTELPAKDGFYWYKEDGMSPCPVEWDATDQYVQFPGDEIYRWAEPLSLSKRTIASENGMFWSEPLTPPQSP